MFHKYWTYLFTPSSGWNVIYFLDATQWLDNKFKLYRLPLTYDSLIWQNIKINQKQTFGEQANAGRRPRIGWKSLYPQIKDYAKKFGLELLKTLLNKIT